MTLLVTGGAGFIGGNFILDWLAQSDERIINLDALTYAGNLASLAPIKHDSRHLFVHGDINDQALLDSLLATHQPRAIVHMAAHTHVDRSINDPETFVRANLDGTSSLLQATLRFWRGLPPARQTQFRFLHISTDEVYGSLPGGAAPSTEDSPYQPSSPYSASKAGSDHLVMAWHRTYGLPVLVSHCSNNYGPRQFPEKLIPLFIFNALGNRPLPLYGDGQQQRDWLHVSDHCAALRLILERGQPGNRYNVGSGMETCNLDLVHALCHILDTQRPRADGRPHAQGIQHVTDRPGHDTRYALNTGKILRELGWQASTPLEQGLQQTINWYLESAQWLAETVSGSNRQRQASANPATDAHIDTSPQTRP